MPNIVRLYGDVDPYYGVNVKDMLLQIENLGDVDEIEVRIDSFGGDLNEGMAIHNELRKMSTEGGVRIKTVCMGMVCSAAGIIFCAGDDREMVEASALLVHDPWTYAAGNAREMRETADRLDELAAVAKTTYQRVTSLSEEELNMLLSLDAYMSPALAMEYGFATAIVANKDANASAASTKKAFARKVIDDQMIKDGLASKEPEGTKGPEGGTGADGGKPENPFAKMFGEFM